MCVGRRLQHVMLRLCGVPLGIYRGRSKGFRGAHPPCLLTEQRKPSLFEKKNSKELPDVWANPQTGNKTGEKCWIKGVGGVCFHWWVIACLPLQSASAVTVWALNVPLCDHRGGQGDRLLKYPPLLSTDRCYHRWLCNVWCEKYAKGETREREMVRDSCSLELHLQSLHGPDSAHGYRNVMQTSITNLGPKENVDLLGKYGLRGFSRGQGAPWPWKKDSRSSLRGSSIGEKGEELAQAWKEIEVTRLKRETRGKGTACMSTVGRGRCLWKPFFPQNVSSRRLELYLIY